MEVLEGLYLLKNYKGILAYNTHNFLKLPSYDMNSHINKQLMEIFVDRNRSKNSFK
ncbi:conserved hypothetical protein [Clostridioides difficile]|uniref:Uncharacterized protein n=1 Tax=Clostridioides difficile TaxID=1496 RepID=A0A069A4T2_CLODI|nr:hypothetical protein HMPREF9945_00408 [Clostridioides difficile 70-100-2010]EQE50613.1 hypothetical protein QCA_0154 [Clostridioides difficile CD40]CDS83121.1 conserved hypothetical protein [Clostridioides difficile]